MDIGKEIRTIQVDPAEVPVPQRERTSPGRSTPEPTRRPAVPPRKAPDGDPATTPERDPVKT